MRSSVPSYMVQHRGWDDKDTPNINGVYTMRLNVMLACGLSLLTAAGIPSWAQSICYAPAPGHVTGTLSGEVPLENVAGVKLPGGTAKFDGNLIQVLAHGNNG